MRPIACLTPLDLAGARAVKTAKAGRGPEAIDLAPDGRRAWVAASAMRQLAAIDVAGRKIVKLVESGDTPDGMASVKR